ncbi:MAG: hypothetical protein GYB51_06815 [Rhodobacteraceae bacterium]|nr:hypothetical protein [Paracoccaceae bacterium]
MPVAPLITPINVDACVFTEHSSTLDVRHMDYADRFNQYLTPEPPVLPDPPQAALPYMLHQRGITVFWTLPYALRTGRQTETALEFDALPNRWLVVRAETTPRGTAPEITWDSRAWVVASDYVGDAIDAVTTFDLGIDWAEPEAENTAFRPTTLGAVMKIGDFQELGAAGRGATEPLTVTSGGTELFVSFEPFCRNIYSFRDPLEGHEDTAASFSYYVVGWYGEPGIDPIAQLAETAGEDVDAFLTALQAAEGWTTSATPGAVPPTALYFGTIADVAWTPDSQPQNVSPDRDDVLVVVGESAEDALDTMLTYAAGEDTAPFARELERLGLRFSAGLKDRLDLYEDMGGLTREAALLHQEGFSGLRNQTAWSVSEPQAEDGTRTPVAPVPDPVRLSVARLNAKEAELFELHQRAEQKRGAIADTLWKAGRLKYMGPAGFPAALGDMTTYWDNIRRELGYMGTEDPATLVGALEAIMARQTRLSQEITTLAETVRADLAELHEGYRLEEIAGHRFWQAVEPVVMMTTDKGALFPEGADPQYLGEDGLEVGLAPAADASVTLSPGAQPVTVTPGAVWQMLSFDSDVIAKLEETAPGLAPWVAGIIGWSMLGDPLIGPAALAAQTGAEATPEALRQAMASAAATAGLVFNPLTNCSWSQPWFPLFLEWRVDLTHFPLFTDAGQANWSFDGSDYELTATATAQGTSNRIQGRTLLSSHLRRTVGNALRNQLSDFGASQEEIADLLGELDQWDFLTQRLSGLSQTQSLYDGELKRIGEAAAMLPPGDGAEGAAPTPPPWQRAGPYAALPGTHDLFLPTTDDQWNPNNTTRFRDLSGQQMVIDQLLVLDRYGQSLHVAGKFQVEQEGRLLTDRDMAVSDMLAAERNLTPQPGRELGTVIQVPPRVLQPVRARLSAVEAVTEAGGNVTALADPVIGFVTLNRYNKEIQVFAATGRLLGAIHPGLGDSVVFEPLAAEITDTADLAAHDPDLQRFVEAVLNGGQPGRFRDFSALLDAAGWRVDPANEREAYLSVLTGEPLALYRATFDFQAAGDPLRNPFRYFPFEAGVAGSGLPSYATQPFPYLLGDPLDPNDGLVGYYLEDDFDRFFTPYDPVDDAVSGYVSMVSGVNAPRRSFAEGPVQVVLLANPHGTVQLRTGIAPVTRLELPVRYWASQLEVMNPSFSFGPLLTEYETDATGSLTGVLLPQSNIEAGHLHWQVGEGRTVPVIPADATSGTTTRPRAFLWGRVLFDIRGQDGGEE